MIALRLAGPEDVAGIARIHVDAWHKAYDGKVPPSMSEAVSLATRTEMWQVLLTDYANSHPAWVAFDDKDGAIVGFAMASRLGESSDSGEALAIQAEIHMLFVAPRFQRRDLGRRLFAVSAAWLVAQGCATAMASVLETPQALGFFRAMGGIELTSTRLDIPGHAVTQHLFIWRDLAAALSHSLEH